MPFASVNGIELYWEEAGSGLPVVFCHEFAADYRGWEPQMRAFGRLYRCVTYSQRGFPPSSVPTEPEAYSQETLVEDLRGLAEHLGIQRAHFVGFSMGGNVVLNLGLKYPSLCRSLTVVGTGAGTVARDRFEQDIERTVALLRKEGIERFAEVYAEGPTRQPFKRKDPHGWQVFRTQLRDHDAEGQALTMLGVQMRRPTIFELEGPLRDLDVPTLIVIGDEDEPCIEPAVFLKRHIRSSGLFVLPQSGHAVNLEEPALFNGVVQEFFRLVENGRWATRAAVSTSLLP
ncbi:MAG: alpha/beta hydrolase [Chloroflexi bacterium]|nr:alpha/beta hydrolase [Chloroflexota bacterium]